MIEFKNGGSIWQYMKVMQAAIFQLFDITGNKITRFIFKTLSLVVFDTICYISDEYQLYESFMLDC
jgi:hypothetical protein